MGKKTLHRGISRAILVVLSELGEATSTAVGKKLGVSQGHAWVLLDRARSYGLVGRRKKGRLVKFNLTKAGIQRIKWLEENDLI